MTRRVLSCAASILSAAVICLLAMPLVAQVPPDEEIRPYDTVLFKNRAGAEETVSGEIIDEKFDRIVFRMASGGSFELMRTDIVSVTKRRSKEDVYKAKLGKLPRPGSEDQARAAANLALGLWCRLPEPRLAGAAPAPEQAFHHLLKAVQLDPTLHEAYPHLLDIIAEGGVTRNDEVQIYTLAAKGGFSHPEIDFRLGELYLEMGLVGQAKSRFEDVLAASAPRNNSLRRRARLYLSRIYLSREEFDRALELYEPDLAATPDDPAAFDNYYMSARILLSRNQPQDRETARDYLQKARNAQPGFPGVQLQLAALDYLGGKPQTAQGAITRALPSAAADPAFHIALGVVSTERGFFEKAASAFRNALAIIEERGERERDVDDPLLACQAHLGLGLLEEFSGRPAAGVESYRLALAAHPSSAEAALLLARGLLATSELDEAEAILRRAIISRPEDAALFAAASRVLADIELGRGNDERALIFLGYAIAVQDKDTLLNRRLGEILIRAGRLEAGVTHLRRAQELGSETPELLCALGYYHYKRGEMGAAEDSFTKVLRLVPAPRKDAKGNLPPVPETRLYALEGIEKITDYHELEVWEDNFARESGDEIRRGWLKLENYGVRVTVEDDRILFSGTQTNEADGVTKLFRDVDTKDVHRVSARLRFPEGARVRAGLRIETPEDTAGAGVVFFRDFDGTMRFAVKTSNSGWEDGRPTPETDKDAAQGKLVFSGTVTWPADSEYHTLMIKTAEGTRAKGYDLLLDGEPVAHNVSVGSWGRRLDVLQVGVSGQVESLGTPYRFDVDDFRVYRKRTRSARAGSR